MSNAVETAKAIKKSVKKTKAYENGTVITWTSHSSRNGVDYLYAAIFVNGLWYTTLVRDNVHLRTTMSNEDLMEYFGTNEGVQDIRVASEFENVN